MIMINDNNYNNNINYNNEDNDKHIVKLGKEKLLQCFTCPLCLNLFSHATTISECLHTFCRQCIYDKIEHEDLDSCPVCDIDLGGVPLDKLRADHHLQDLRAKIFPSELEKLEVVIDPVTSFRSPMKQKERSLASLVSNTSPKMSLVVSREDPLPPSEDSPKSLGSQETLSREVSANGNHKMEDSAINESPKKQFSSDEMEENGLADEVNPANDVTEAASEGTKADYDNEKPRENGRDHEAEVNERRRSKRRRVCVNRNDSTPSDSAPVRRKKIRRRREKRDTVVPESDLSRSSVVNQNMGNMDSEFGRKFNPIWFSLIASNQQEGNEPLPQISSCYLRVKDGSVTVSLVKKYLAKKLDLASDDEVEIKLRGQPLIPSFQLHKLVDLWIQTSPLSQLIPSPPGSSGKEFVLVLSYGRKTRP